MKLLERPDILEALQTQLHDAYAECEKRILKSADHTDNGTVKLQSTMGIDVSEPRAIVSLKLEWPEKAIEDGLDVKKTFSSTPLTQRLEDQKQQTLGIEPPKKPIAKSKSRRQPSSK
jgi:hypothetical protein